MMWGGLIPSALVKAANGQAMHSKEKAVWPLCCNPAPYCVVYHRRFQAHKQIQVSSDQEDK
jgi:hypothetical protein